MMASVSTLIDRRGAAPPSRTVNFSIPHLPTPPEAAQQTADTWDYRFAQKTAEAEGPSPVLMNAEFESVKAVGIGVGNRHSSGGLVHRQGW
jgi:hypothetical protein